MHKKGGGHGLGAHKMPLEKQEKLKSKILAAVLFICFLETKLVISL